MAQSKITREGFGTIAAIAVAIIWGLSFVSARMVLFVLSPVLLATIRFIIASFLFLPLIVKEYRRDHKFSPKDLKELALLGFLSISVYFWLQYTGVKYAGAGTSAILVVGLIPIITGLASNLILKEVFKKQKILGTTLGLMGVAFITLPGLFIEEIDVMFYIGVVCLLMNALCWAAYSTLSRRLMKRIDRPSLVTAYVTIFGTLVLVPMSLTSDWKTVNLLQNVHWVNILYLAIICSGLGYYLWNFALSRVEAVKAAVWLYLEPVAAFIGELIIFGSTPSLTTFIGGTMVIVGAVLTTRTK